MIESLTTYSIIGIGLAMIMLIIGSIIDIWKREIHDYYWIGFGITGFLLVFLSSEIIPNLLLIGFALIIAPFVILVWRIGLFGGADAFALIALAVIAPMATFSGNPVSPFTTLSNAAILFVIPFLINISRNILAKIRGENIFEGFEEYNHLTERVGFVNRPGGGVTKIILMGKYKGKIHQLIFDLMLEKSVKLITDVGKEYMETPNTGWKEGIPTDKPSVNLDK